MDEGSDAFRVLAIDDEPELLRVTKRMLGPRGFELETFTDASAGLDTLRERGHEFDLVLLDLNMPERHGLEVLPDIHEIDPDVPVVVVTSDNNAETAVAALRKGAFSYLVKPIDADAAALTLSNACHFGRLNRRAHALEHQLGIDIGGLVGSSRKMAVVYQLIERVAATDAPILIVGESGTGKELVARRIHQRSRRSAQPFVPLNCGAFPESMIDSELFGHERGSFTGAVSARPGAFVEAHRGTLLLDEIGDVPLAVQLRLLRVLQEGEVRPVGGTGVRKVDVRVLAATNVDLEQAVKEKRFRQDLYYRLDVITIRLPPLRERPEDIPDLVAHFVRKHARADLEAPTLDSETLGALLDHDWPGNVRELENVVQRAVVLCPTGVIGPRHLPPALRPGWATSPADTPPRSDEVDAFSWTDELSFVEARKRAQLAFEKGYIKRLLERCEDNQSVAARRAGLDRSNFRRILKRLRAQVDSE